MPFGMPHHLQDATSLISECCQSAGPKVVYEDFEFGKKEGQKQAGKMVQILRALSMQAYKHTGHVSPPKVTAPLTYLLI